MTTEVVTVVVKAVVEVETVDTRVDVAVSKPPNGAKRRIVESGAGGRVGEIGGGGTTTGDDPTIQPLLGVIMYTEFSHGGFGVNPNNAGARVMCVQATPSQWKIVAINWLVGAPSAGTNVPAVQQSVGPVQYIEFKVGGNAIGPPGIVGVETRVQCVPSQ